MSSTRKTLERLGAYKRPEPAAVAPEAAEVVEAAPLEAALVVAAALVAEVAAAAESAGWEAAESAG